MNETLKEVCDALDKLSESILNGWSDNRTFNEVWGWSFPNISRHDLAKIPRQISNEIKDLNSTIVEEGLLVQIEDIPGRLDSLRSRTVPYLYNGNAQQAIPAILSTLEWVRTLILPITNWQIVNNSNAMPNKIARRLNSINAQLAEINPEKEKLEAEIKLIKEAKEAAENLPIDLDNLKTIRKKVSGITTEAAELLGKIDSLHKSSIEQAKTIQEKKAEADKLVDQCEEAYRITTTKGLAAAFDQRAKSTSITMWCWVLGLLVALAIGVWIGYTRFQILSDVLQKPDLHWGVICTHLLLSFLSFAAPIWFAWLATKQINQRFKLSEDYGFKASVAKAYEGYRKEAARIDPIFEARLFSSALTRLEEAPIRLLEKEGPGSPWQELVNSAPFQNALLIVPDLKAKFFELTNKALDQTKLKDKSDIIQKETEG